ncbi:MAG TPA: hypothetical protein VE176_04065 [Candidatus Limnocylindrales bacterium]|nr:hypothetical protein [Candidatus Limnocylindrales bacterium]
MTGIDLGLALKDTKVPKRLIDTGGFASMKDIDADVKKWLTIAYEMDRWICLMRSQALRTACSGQTVAAS